MAWDVLFLLFVVIASAAFEPWRFKRLVFGQALLPYVSRGSLNFLTEVACHNTRSTTP